MATDSGESSSTYLSGVREERNPRIGLLGTLAIGAETMIAAGIFVLSRVAISNGDLRE